MNEGLIAALIGLGIQFGPELVADVASVIKGNPKNQDETDPAYIARLTAQVEANTVAIDKQDDEIQGTTVIYANAVNRGECQ
jgi:hypothetical protein